MTNTNITFLIGAGASANALPIVSGMKDRMAIYLNYLKHGEKSNEMMRYVKKEQDKIHKDFSQILKELLVHFTPDTYAKKLALRNEKEKLRTLKFFLSTYLLFEQAGLNINKSRQWGYLVEGLPSGLDKPHGRKVLENMDVVKDHRYDVFYATLLNSKGDKIILPENVNIISWNYDLQFELSYCDFDGANSINAFDALNISPVKESQGAGGCIVKLNGMAGLSSKKAAKNVVANSLLELMSNPIEAIGNVFNAYCSGEDYMPFLNFAWEENEKSKRSVMKAKEIVRETDILVVIGYSFPNFNKMVDLEIFGNKKFEKIYYQSHPDNIEAQIQALKWFLQIKSDNVFPIIDLNQFFIPPEFVFSKHENSGADRYNFQGF